MKSSFSRSFCITAAILLIAMTILGASFQMQVNQYLTEIMKSAFIKEM